MMIWSAQALQDGRYKKSAMRNPVFLLGSHKSGTSLLRSLLDGSDELFVIPIEAHFFQFSGWWVDYALRRSPPVNLSFDEVVDSFTQHIRQSNERTSQTSDSKLTGRWNVDRFTEHLNKTGQTPFENADFRGFLDRYVEAMHISLYGDSPAVRRFAEKSVENAEYAPVLKTLYPQAKFVHLIRNPYATLVALRRHLARRHYPFLGNAIEALDNSYYHLYKNPSILPDYLVVRYEDLVAEPSDVMKQVATFIDIDFSESLLEPTLIGEPWAGNSSSGSSFSGISSEPLTTWRREIRSLEIHFVNAFFAHVLRDHGYERLMSRVSAYRPVQGENPRSYLANRLFWAFSRATGSASWLI
jgi:protein-tyrosine sulfotransferase